MKNSQLRISLLLLIAFTVLASCAPAVPTKLPAPIVYCEVVTPVRTEVVLPRFDNKIIFFLIDKSGSYRRYDEDHDYAAESLEMIARVLPRIISPGDEVYVSWLGSKTGEKKIYRGKVREVNESLAFTKFPVCPGVPPEIPTLEVSGSALQRKKKIELNASIIATSTVQMNEYNCDLSACNNQIIDKVSEAEQLLNLDVEKAKRDFLQDATPKILEAEGQGLDDTTDIYEGVYTVSRLMTDPTIKGKYKEYILVIFSDMEHQSDDFNGEIELSDVNVVVANMYCTVAEKCRELESEWSVQFAEWNVSDQIFSYVFQTSDDSLVEIFSEMEGDK